MRLIQMSISAGVLICVILLLRRGGRRLFSPGFIYLMWFAAAARMLVPVNIPLSLPEIGFETSWQDSTLEEHFANDQGPGLAGEAGKAGNVDMDGFVRLAILLWGLGFMALLSGSLWIYMRQYRLFKEAIPLRDNEYINRWMENYNKMRKVSLLYFDRISAPVTYGIWNTRIVFPSSMDLQDTRSLDYILRHESVHIRRFDNLWKMVVMAAVCVHWFNPLAWVMWSRFNRDMELACDQAVAGGMDKRERIAYAMTLLRYAGKNEKVSLLCNGFGKSSVKERITILMKYGKRSKIGIVCSAMVMAMSMTVFASTSELSVKTGAASEYLGESPTMMLYKTPQFKEYENAGLNYDSNTDLISYNNRVVGDFSDEYAPGKINHMQDLAGNLCLEAQRDESGRLTGFREVDKKDYLKNASEADRRKAQERGFINAYGPYGLSYDEQTGYLAFNGKLVAAIQDDGGCGNYVSNPQGDTTCLQIVRDKNGAITDVREMTVQAMSELLNQKIGVHKTADGWGG